MHPLNKKTVFVFFLMALFLSGCKTRQTEELKGFWENENKIIEFADSYFVLCNKNAPDVAAFRGTYAFAQNPPYALKMTYQEFLNSGGEWESLKDTELENYTDTLLFKVDRDSLETKVLGNGQSYFYTRTVSPASGKTD